jgi:hypothetical protein
MNVTPKNIILTVDKLSNTGLILGTSLLISDNPEF